MPMAINEKFKDILKFRDDSMHLMSREYGHLISKSHRITDDISYPNYPDEEAIIKKNIKSLLKGAVLTNMFAMWEQNTPDDILDWLTEDEKTTLQAFRHVRDSFAHNYFGGRAARANRRTAFEAKLPFSNISFDTITDKIDISKSTVDKDCWDFFQSLYKRLVQPFYENKKP